MSDHRQLRGVDVVLPGSLTIDCDVRQVAQVKRVVHHRVGIPCRAWIEMAALALEVGTFAPADPFPAPLAGCAGACAVIITVVSPNAAAAVSCIRPMTASRFTRESGHCTLPMHGEYEAKCPH